MNANLRNTVLALLAGLLITAVAALAVQPSIAAGAHTAPPAVLVLR
ncbi:MAG TPA: hypothetical protein VMW31_00465 [Devosiaceae bacterium]|nr:hypothetical protein [Devosiaceae bacterium]